ncbi:MarR family transcriptional regulator [Streptohalobacillus salinus]|uniref:MarR family transcriptional regulator n=1 Tax=Streptohalobacillus salinus TaxID=621096 RepID=A0A2V3W2D7_9BACI|nr:MarR family transcriptional regulator [Streptohalobacillus salinus]PXW88457.1 MarR family transcriptional regulator [Streptohalobacillus salinus]
MCPRQNYSELFFLIKQVDLQLTQVFENKLDISVTRYEMLLHLLSATVMTQTQLQQKMRINQAAITRHVKILEDKGLAIRARNPKNNREVLVQISSAGKTLLTRCDEKKHVIIEQLFDHYSEEQMALFKAFLTDVNERSTTLLNDHTI